MSTNRDKGALNRTAYILENEEDPRGSNINTVYVKTTLDQVIDPSTPDNKTLREILENLKEFIITGGEGSIVFPVTSVNKKTGDVLIKKSDIGLGSVNDTADLDKPLSNPQRAEIMNILAKYDFKIDLEDIYEHIKNTDNPHKVSLESLDKNKNLTHFVERLIFNHSIDTDHLVHSDIRDSLSKLWNLTDNINKDTNHRIDDMLDRFNKHDHGENAHIELFLSKEDKKNKRFEINKESNNDDYPSAKAVFNHVKDEINKVKEIIPKIVRYIENFEVYDTEYSMPPAGENYLDKCIIIKKGKNNQTSIATIVEVNNKYEWAIRDIGSYSVFDDEFFVNTSNGLSLRLDGIINAILDNDRGVIEYTLARRLQDYYTKEEIEAKHYISDLEILPGTVDGTIRFYINDNKLTMSPDVRVAGLQRCAFLESIGQDQILDQSIYSRHIMTNAIDDRCIKNGSIKSISLSTPVGTLLGNLGNENERAESIGLETLANELKPLLKGEIDLSDKAGITWKDVIDQYIMNPTHMDPDTVYKFMDGSFAIRYTGKISILPNMPKHLELSTEITSEKYRLIDAGGTWEYSTDPSEWTILGGSNITGHTFATVNLTKRYLEFESISIGDRLDAEYDIWVKYRSI